VEVRGEACIASSFHEGIDHRAQPFAVARIGRIDGLRRPGDRIFGGVHGHVVTVGKIEAWGQLSAARAASLVAAALRAFSDAGFITAVLVLERDRPGDALC
jgi:hypothetical protein